MMRDEDPTWYPGWRYPCTSATFKYSDPEYGFIPVLWSVRNRHRPYEEDYWRDQSAVDAGIGRQLDIGAEVSRADSYTNVGGEGLYETVNFFWCEFHYTSPRLLTRENCTSYGGDSALEQTCKVSRTFDDAGRVVIWSATGNDPDCHPPGSYTLAYSDDGRQIDQREQGPGRRRVRYELDDDFQIVLVEERDDTGETFRRRTYDYDDDGRLVRVETEEPAGTLMVVDQRTYDDAGRLAQREIDLGPNPDGVTDNGSTFTYQCPGEL